MANQPQGASFLPPFYTFEPKEDITPLEAAWISYLFYCLRSPGTDFEVEEFAKWNLIKRHFKWDEEEEDFTQRMEAGYFDWIDEREQDQPPD